MSRPTTSSPFDAQPHYSPQKRSSAAQQDAAPSELSSPSIVPSPIIRSVSSKPIPREDSTPWSSTGRDEGGSELPKPAESPQRRSLEGRSEGAERLKSDELAERMMAKVPALECENLDNESVTNHVI